VHEVIRSRSRRGFPAFAAVLVTLLMAPPSAFAADAGVVSELRGTRPAVSGLELEVVDGDRFLSLRNESGKQVIVKGYEDEPYLRFLPNRVVEENTRSPSKYANEDRYALTPLPPQANSAATPKWRAVSRDGSFKWFDHRIHSMERGTPPQVKDESVRTKIFDWRVPMTVGGAPVAAVGTLEWVPADSSGSSTGLIVALAAAAVLVLAALAFLLTRRRRPRPAVAPAAASGEPAEPARREAADEAW
jgi:hypothetical protein